MWRGEAYTGLDFRVDPQAGPLCIWVRVRATVPPHQETVSVK